jgi:hypothetical protein
MVEHERPILDHPERLQYPTETWAAQDIRKWHVLSEASVWCREDAWSAKMKSKAEFFFEASVKKLDSFETKSLCRPVILMLNYGWQRPALAHADPRAEATVVDENAFGEPMHFRPQREVAIARAKRFIVASFVAGLALLVAGAVWWFRG